MEWLNYHHLLYFWMTAKEGSIVKASQKLRLSHPTISGQIHRLEEVLGQQLLRRKGRNLVLTEMGRVTFRYADEIFSLGRELQYALKGEAHGRKLRLVVGVSDVLAKSIVHKIVAPALALTEPVQLICREDRTTKGFLADLAVHEIDLILSDSPAGPGSSEKAFSHLLGECGMTFFAAPTLAKKLKPKFPASLAQVPFVMPGSDSTLRRSLNEWFNALSIRPQIAAELDDAALAAVFCEEGLGVCLAPEVIEKEITRRYRVQVIGRAPAITQRFYAISAERKLAHPAVVAICERARRHIFAS